VRREATQFAAAATNQRRARATYFAAHSLSLSSDETRRLTRRCFVESEYLRP